MTRVFGVHEIELNPGVKEEDFENFFLNEMAAPPSTPAGACAFSKVIGEYERANM